MHYKEFIHGWKVKWDKNTCVTCYQCWSLWERPSFLDEKKSSDIVVLTTCTLTNAKTVFTPKQSNKNHRTPFLPCVRPLKRGILGPVPFIPRVANVNPKRPSPPPPFCPPPKKPRPPDTHRVSQKRPRNKTTLKATTPAKLSPPPIPILISPIQKFPCPLNPSIPPHFLPIFLLSQCLSANSLTP